MADRKISALTELTAPASGDLFPVVDISEADNADKNKRITYGTMFRALPDGTDGTSPVSEAYAAQLAAITAAEEQILQEEVDHELSSSDGEGERAARASFYESAASAAAIAAHAAELAASAAAATEDDEAGAGEVAEA